MVIIAIDLALYETVQYSTRGSAVIFPSEARGAARKKLILLYFAASEVTKQAQACSSCYFDSSLNDCAFVFDIGQVGRKSQPGEGGKSEQVG